MKGDIKKSLFYVYWYGIFVGPETDKNRTQIVKKNMVKQSLRDGWWLDCPQLQS